MENKPKINTYAILYLLKLDKRSHNDIDKEYGYLSTQELADEAIKMLTGYYIIIKEEVKLPVKYFTDVKSWAKEYLTVNKYLKHFKEL